MSDKAADAGRAEVFSPSDDDRSMRSIDRIVAVLNALTSEDAKALTVLEIAKATGLNRAVVHRFVEALVGHDLAERSTSGKYRIGPRMLLYSNTYLDHLEIRRIALPYLVELRESMQTIPNVVVTLNLRVGAEMAVVESLWDTRTALDSIMQVGKQFPMTEAASGMVIAAYMKDELFASLVGDGMARDLQSRLEGIRHAGGIDYSVGEFQASICGVCAVVFTEMTADVALGAFGRDIDPSLLNRESDLARSVRRTADVIGEAMKAVRQ